MKVCSNQQRGDNAGDHCDKSPQKLVYLLARPDNIEMLRQHAVLVSDVLAARSSGRYRVSWYESEQNPM